MRKKEAKTIRKKEKKGNKMLITLVAGIVVGLIIFAVLLNVEKNIMANYEKTAVVVAKTVIPEGTLLTEENLGEYLVVKENQADMVPKTAIASMEELNQYLADYEIEEGTMLTQGMFLSYNELTESIKEKVLVSFSTPQLSQCVSGVVRAGDKIDLYCTKEESIEGTNERKTVVFTKDVWNDVLVYNSYSTDGALAENGDKTAIAQTFTVILDREDVEDFLSDLVEASVRVVKISN